MTGSLLEALRNVQGYGCCPGCGARPRVSRSRVYVPHDPACYRHPEQRHLAWLRGLR